MSYPEAPDHTGVAPKHKEAAERAKAGEANNMPMAKGYQKINWNLSVHDGAIVQMSPEEYMERVNIFNRYPLGKIIHQEMKAQERGYRGIGYYPPLSEHSYKSILEGIKAGNEMDIPNLIYKEGWMQNQEGFHRALVARDLGLKQIPVHVIGRMPKEFVKAQRHRNISMIEQVEAINTLKEKYLASEK